MALSRRTKQVLTVVAAVVVTLAAVFAFEFYRAFEKFGVEDCIHATFYPVLNALDEYEHDHGAPAASLAQLVPKYIPQIPSSDLVDLVEYSVVDGGQAWQLRLHSVALNPPRSYYCRSSDNYAVEEKARMIIRYHGRWVVLKD